MKTVLLSLFFASLLWVDKSDAKAKKVIEVRADEWCPYNCTPNSRTPGFMIEIAMQALKKKGWKLEYKTMNWARAIEQGRSGKIDAIVGAAKDDAPDFVYPDVAIGHSGTCFYGRPNESWQYKNPNSIKSVRLGVIRDYSYSEEVDQYIADKGNAKRIFVASGAKALDILKKKTLAKRGVDVIVEDPMVFNHSLKNKKQFKKLGCSESSDVHIAFSPKNSHSKEWAKIVSDEMMLLRKTGRLKGILEKYNAVDWVNQGTSH